MASLSHAGILFPAGSTAAPQPRRVSLAIVLAVAGVAAWSWPQRARHIAPAALAFACLGTLVGAFTIAVAIGPQTRADLVLHALSLLGLALGLVTTWPKRTRRSGRNFCADPGDARGAARCAQFFTAHRLFAS